jgi:hypothetical protein
MREDSGYRVRAVGDGAQAPETAYRHDSEPQEKTR